MLLLAVDTNSYMYNQHSVYTIFLSHILFCVTMMFLGNGIKVNHSILFFRHENPSDDPIPWLQEW